MTIKEKDAISIKPHQIAPISPETVATMVTYLAELQKYCLSGIWAKISPNMRKSLFQELKLTFAWVKYHAPLLELQIDLKNMAGTMNLIEHFSHTGNRILTEEKEENND